MQGKRNTMIKRIVDVCMTVLLLCLMAYQVTGEALHEWIGIGMTVLVIIHQILNRKWYGAIFKGKYNNTLACNIVRSLSHSITAIPQCFSGTTQALQRERSAVRRYHPVQSGTW